MSATTYAGPERRQHPRKTIEALADISFGSNNRGVVLDVSEGGLRFRTLALVPKAGTLHFWFSAEGHRVDAQGEVAWIDETQKTGGLRFKVLPPDARGQIRNWVSLSTMALTEGELVPPPLPSLGRVDKTNVVSTSAPREERLQSKKASLPVGGFSRGLVSGFLISSLAGAVIFLYIDRRQLGESLIKVGERLSAKSSPQTTSQTQAPIPFAPIEGPASPSLRIPANPQQRKVELTEPAILVSGIYPAISLPMTEIGRGPSLVPAEPAGSGRLETANNSSPNAPVADAGLEQPSTDAPEEAPNAAAISASKKYLDVSDFRQEAAADKSRDSLEQLGFHASVSRKSHLWMSSYRVLVGPYTNDEDVEIAHNDLESHGFHLHSRARRSRKFILPLLTLAGTDTVVRDCIISWDSNSSAATVAFLKGENVVSKTQGRWVKKGVTYKVDAVLSAKSDRGPQTLLEIQCHGMNQALVFDETKPVRYFIPPYRSGL